MARMLASTLLTLAAVFGVSALAFAEETVIEKRVYEEHQKAVEVAPAPKERVIEEHTIVKEPPTVQKRTDTVVEKTKTKDNDDDDDDNDND